MATNLKTTRLVANVQAVPVVDASGNPTGFSLNDILAGRAGEVLSISFDIAAAKPAGQAFMMAPAPVKAGAAKPAAKSAPAAKTQANKPEAGTVRPVKRNSNIHQLLVMLNRKNGATFKEIKEKFGWTDGAVGSYLYGYPEEKGYAKETFQRANGEKAYRLVMPDGVKDIAVA